jgi:DNA-binding PadR family transcriptional regulator
MTPADIELMQEKIVRLCNAAGRFGLTEDRMLRYLADDEYRISADELDRQLRYLKSKGWIEEVEKDLRPDRRRWQTTAAGDEFLMKRGLL